MMPSSMSCLRVWKARWLRPVVRCQCCLTSIVDLLGSSGRLVCLDIVLGLTAKKICWIQWEMMRVSTIFDSNRDSLNDGRVRLL